MLHVSPHTDHQKEDNMGLLDSLFAKRGKTPDTPLAVPGASSQANSREADSLDANEWVSRGHALVNQGRIEDAITAFRSATACDPKNAASWAALAALLSKLGKLDDGIAAYRKALELAPSWVQLWGGLGAALAEHRDAGEAINAFRQLTETQPGDARAWKRLAKLLLKVGNAREAISVLTSATWLFIPVESEKDFRDIRLLLALRAETKHL
jgi:tetratricopeptide (TPR) repeat protein